MVNPVYGFNRRDSRVLKHLARGSNPLESGLGSAAISSLRAYVVVPEETIPAAKRITTTVTTNRGSYQRDTLKPGSGTATIFRRDKDSVKGELWQSVDEAGDVVIRDVYNISNDPIIATGDSSHSGVALQASPYYPQEDRTNIKRNDPVVIALEDAWGDLWIIQANTGSSSASSTSDSTSESDPSTSEESESASEGSDSTSGSTSGDSTSDSVSADSTSDSTSGDSTSVSESASTSFSVSGSDGSTSDDPSTSGGSDESTSGAPAGCVSVVSSLSFNSATCVLSYETVNVQSCGDAGSGGS